VSIVETSKVGEITKLILQLAPISNENAVNVVVRKGESEALRARLPVVIQ
jgi:hypothetical protein